MEQTGERYSSDMGLLHQCCSVLPNGEAGNSYQHELRHLCRSLYRALQHGLVVCRCEKVSNFR